MKIILLGASGTIGAKVYAGLSDHHEIITASPRKGQLKVDIVSRKSIEEMYKAAGEFDAVVVCAGEGHFGPFDTMTEDDFYKGIRHKMMGQVNLLMVGKNHIRDNGSFTLITGILADDPVRDSAGLALVNGAINSFVRAAAREVKRGIRVNAVSPGMVEDSLEYYGPFFPGHLPVPMKKVVNAYIRSIEGNATGEVIRVFE
jgi:NAD(P)-dependent dehydrogenase (short-subunit alcohol dehydrogenase family)